MVKARIQVPRDRPTDIYNKHTIFFPLSNNNPLSQQYPLPILYIYISYFQPIFPKSVPSFHFLITIYRAPPSFLRRRKVQQRRFGHGESKNPVPPCPLDQQGGAQSREALSLSLFGESLAGVTAGRPPLCPPLQPQPPSPRLPHTVSAAVTSPSPWAAPDFAKALASHSARRAPLLASLP